MLSWGNRFNICCLLDNHNYHLQHGSVECVLAAGSLKSIQLNAGNAFSSLKSFAQENNDWLFGHFSYGLKNEVENLSTVKEDHVQFPDLFFFVPETIILLDEKSVSISSEKFSAQEIFDQLQSTKQFDSAAKNPVTFQQRFSHDEYIQTINKLKAHILKGDCYEINFCQEFFADNISIDPELTYHSLSAVSPNPFAAYYKLDDKFLLCASPERYLKKENQQLISQPIKGTWQRNHESEAGDESYKQALYNSQKDRAENVMVVDLVRNDLSKICEEGTVKVDELFGIYTFPQVHQMISTISGTMRSDLHWVDAIKATFPMGSMTGAPKKRVMELIDQYEKTNRGIYSGAVGYVKPNGDFDFNVVIRSLMYNESNRYLSYQVGGGITFYSDPELEYEECLLKAQGIKRLF
ncbi:anthranilate synthase component I family protein [Parasegetibacter sp. MAH-26]|uniref:Anthranilate synthase component I family protein n=2 Tax=Pinibacter aurantiacus TaxID=2851599 RepID=A0A9E2W1S3_9BACT|nr:anthranilate synthase component I family protein [Pinibacter aurantiacus]MBV4356445.1 anthranilate synthase component I family protein [Pinibacter aurantiacus]